MTTEIKFEHTYGLSPASPLWFVIDDQPPSTVRQFASREEAEGKAAEIALENPGRTFLIAAVVATVETSSEVIGKRFDPSRVSPVALPDPVPEFPEVNEEAPL